MKLLSRLPDGRLNWGRMFAWSGLGLAVLAVYLWFFGVATMFAIGARYLAWSNPLLWKAPTALETTGISPSAGMTLSYLGFEFEVPWTDFDEKRTRPVGTWQFIAFRSGKSITLAKIAPREFVKHLIAFGKPDESRLDQLMGSGTLDSDYAFAIKALRTTPASINLLTPRLEAVRATTLLMFKPAFALQRDSGLFVTDTKNFRGYQCGDPKSRPDEIVDHLFATDVQLDLTFRCARTGPAMQQEEINRVIQTIHAAK